MKLTKEQLKNMTDDELRLAKESVIYYLHRHDISLSSRSDAEDKWRQLNGEQTDRQLSND